MIHPPTVDQVFNAQIPEKWHQRVGGKRGAFRSSMGRVETKAEYPDPPLVVKAPKIPVYIPKEVP